MFLRYTEELIMVCELSPKMEQVLFQLETGSATKAYRRSAWDSRTIDALERRGLITVRDYDGELRVTSEGTKYIHETYYK